MIGEGIFILYIGNKFGTKVMEERILLICKHKKKLWSITGLHPPKALFRMTSDLIVN